MLSSRDAVDPAPRRYNSRVQQAKYPDWLRLRGYAHFDVRPRPEFACAYATDRNRVCVHPFWPFLQFQRMSPRYARDPDSGVRKRMEPKTRPISYAAHLDSCIYSKYAAELGSLLDQRYTEPFGPCVLAYRRLDRPKNNVAFALDAFREIEARGECDVVALDVEDFFGSLDHELLRARWSALLPPDGETRLPDDHYHVFKSITRYSWVDRTALAARLGRRISRRRSGPKDRVCEPREFRELVRPLVQCNTRGKGIPQGSPISAILANLYMLSADADIFQQLASVGSTYRRYSDDILLICPPGKADEAERIVSEYLLTAKLSLKAQKTVRVSFRSSGGRTTCLALDESSGEMTRPAALQYLGLIWDGNQARIRSASLARFLRRMVRAVRGAKAAAIRTGQERLSRRSIYRRFSQLGRSARIFGPQPDHARNRNFIHYGQMASRTCGSETIRRQIGRLWMRLHREIIKAELELKSRPRLSPTTERARVDPAGLGGGSP